SFRALAAQVHEIQSTFGFAISRRRPSNRSVVLTRGSLPVVTCSVAGLPLQSGCLAAVSRVPKAEAEIRIRDLGVLSSQDAPVVFPVWTDGVDDYAVVQPAIVQ